MSRHQIPLDELKYFIEHCEHPELVTVAWDGTKLDVRPRTADELSAALREGAARTQAAEQKAAQLTADLKAAAIKATEDRDRLHDEIEEAHRRWWHRLIGLRWELTGWSWDWRKEPL